MLSNRIVCFSSTLVKNDSLLKFQSKERRQRKRERQNKRQKGRWRDRDITNKILHNSQNANVINDQDIQEKIIGGKTYLY